MSIRMDPGKKNRVIYPADAVFEIGKGYTAKEGTDISIIACGEMVDYALQVADQAEEAGISVRVIDMFTVKPLDEEIVLKAAEETGRIVVWEDHLMKNGLASAVADTLADHTVALKSFKRFGVPQVYPGFGNPEQLYKLYGYECRYCAYIRKKPVLGEIKDECIFMEYVLSDSFRNRRNTGSGKESKRTWYVQSYGRYGAGSDGF